MPCASLEEVFKLKPEDGTSLLALITAPRFTMTARAWVYEERLGLAMEHKRVNVLGRLPWYWCTCVMGFRIDAMKDVAGLIRNHREGIVTWAQALTTNGFLEAINRPFPAAKRRVRGNGRIGTIKPVIFPIADKLDFEAINPHAGHPT